MIDVGIAGKLGFTLAWMCALLLLVTFALAGRVLWALAVRGARRGVVGVVAGLFGVSLTLGLGVAHFMHTPDTLEVAPNGDWVLYDAYGLVVDAIPASEVRQVRLTSPIADSFARLEVRRADGASMMLYGDELRSSLGYAFEQCGAWVARPVWGPHAYDALGPRCSDPPWPAALSHAPGAHRPLAENLR